jgi:putative hydroxymethylpyrimidine transporter CytX
MRPPEWGIEPVRSEYRYLGFLDYFILWSSLSVGLLVFWAGSLLVPALDLKSALVAIILGTIVGNLPLVLVGLIGGRCAIPTMVTLRPSFGIRGSYLPTALNVLQLVGWTAFEIIVMAKAADTIAVSVFGYSNFNLWVVFFAFICAAMAIGGPFLVIRHWLERFAIWIVYATSIWIAYSIVAGHDVWRLFSTQSEGGISLLYAIDLVVAMPVSWMPLVADYGRFARDPKTSLLGTYAGYLVGNVMFYGLGALSVLALGVADPIAAIAAIAFGIPALTLILVDETDNGFADIYSAAVSIQNISSRFKQWTLIIATSMLGMILALIVPMDQYAWFLLWIGAVFIPLFGVVIIDYYVVRSRRYQIDELYKPGGEYWYLNGVNPRAVLAWAVGVTTYFYIVNYASWLGASIPSLIVSALVYLIITRFWKID